MLDEKTEARRLRRLKTDTPVSAPLDRRELRHLRTSFRRLRAQTEADARPPSRQTRLDSVSKRVPERRGLQAGAKRPQGSEARTVGLSFEKLTRHLPFTHAEYMCIVSAFEELDTDGSGTLDWSELCGVETKLHGFVIDYEEYKKLAASTKGAIGFTEVLRALFPKVPTAVLRAVTKKWGEPHDNRTGYGGDWREVLLPRECEEIQAIYTHFVQGCGQPLTLPLLEQRVSAVSPEDLKDVFAAHDADGDGVLSIDEFASLMDIVYGRKGESHSVKLYFQPEELLKEL